MFPEVLSDKSLTWADLSDAAVFMEEKAADEAWKCCMDWSLKKKSEKKNDPESLSTFASNAASQLQRVLWQPKPRRKRTSKQAEQRPLLALRRIQYLCVPQIELLCGGNLRRLWDMFTPF